jgi:hypothetical protein
MLAIATGPHCLDSFFEMFSAASRKHTATDCLNLCPKCTKIRQRVSVSSKHFLGGYTPVPRIKGERREYKREGGITMNGRKGMGKKDEGAGKGG